MAATTSKRPLPAKVAAMKDRKRRKLNNAEPKEESKSKPKPAGAKKVRTNLDALAWKSVDAPDGLDDYEGFFGLEEVEDVDVIRDEGTGVMRFEARPGERNEETSHVDEEDESPSYGSGDEWEGFGDDDVARAATSSPTQSTGKAQQNRSTVLNNQSTGPRPASSQNHGAFVGLDTEEGTDDEDADISAWRSLNLSSDTLSSLSKLKFSTPTPIQKAAIPEVLAGHDVIGKASTGSGKTLAFGIPILEEFLEQRSRATSNNGSNRKPMALILSPTRELAHQLDKHLTALCSNGSFDAPSIATLTGGLAVQKQQRELRNADIIIGTPGRLWEVISGSKDIILAVQGIQFLVVDEADRLLSQGHFKEVEEILNALERKDTDEDGSATQQEDNNNVKPPRQTLIFSATFDQGLQRKLSNKSSSNNLASNKESLEYLLKKVNFREDKPKFVDVNPINQLATGLKEGLIECAGMEKDLYLYTLLLLHPNARALVFTNSISAVKRLTPLLQHLNLPALPLHSGMIQKARLRSVERFTAQPPNGKPTGSILVATDVAARGLDIPSVQLVIHYHLPRQADTYVHRSGRTARAGQGGSSILICGPEEVAGVRRLVAKVHASSAAGGDSGKQAYFIRTLDLDRRLVSRLKPRATLAKKIADAELAKTKGKKEDDFLRAAAEELGVDYESEDDGKGKRGRGAGRKKKEKESRELSKVEVGSMKAELKSLLAKRVNVGVSERYLTSSGLDVDELLRRRDTDGKDFLGSVQDIGL